MEVRLLPSGRVAAVFDVALTVWMVALSQYFVWRMPDPYGLWTDVDTTGRVLLAVVHVPLIARRRYPVAVCWLTCGGAAVYLTIGYYHSAITFAVALAVYSVAAYRRPRVSVPATVAANAVLLWGNRLVEPGMELAGPATAVMVALIAWAFGEATRRAAEQRATLRVLTQRLEREQEEQARRAVVREQGRIARELHDVIAHHMSVVSVQAGLGRYVFDADPPTARRTLDVIGEVAHEALDEMRRMLAMLRSSTDEAPFAEVAGLAQLDDLLARVRAAGATVDVTVTGVSARLHPGPDLCVYRIIQESLTNVLKHADPPHARMSLCWSATGLTVRVENDGAVGPVGEGYGLVGMRERARLYDGRLRADPRPGGGFEVTLELPLDEVTA
ncbi:sensor histidine kinase [Virgisporangium aurantiacum]